MTDTTKLHTPNLNRRHITVNEINYSSNVKSNYTEIMDELGKSYDYANDKDYYWCEPELSVLYGTPLYETASPSQKLALNHLYWTSQYDHIAASEASVTVCNQVTAGVFAAVGGYETLCKELDIETEQEYTHIRTFQKISYKTKVALLGKSLLSNLPTQSSGLSNKSLPEQLIFKPVGEWVNSLSSNYNILHFVTKTMLREQSDFSSPYLKQSEEEKKFVPVSSKGYLGGVISHPWLQFFILNWGSSPFLACQHYTYRFTGNQGLKNYEHNYFAYFKELKRKDEFIPTPTAVSHYHLLDESFHTTTSQLIARDMYKDFSKPTNYERFVANKIMSMMQKGFLNQLSAGLPATFRNDTVFMPVYYKLLRSPVFNMSEEEALFWMKKCLCQEHEGWHVNRKYHQRLLNNLCQLTEKLEYLTPANREMQIMKSGGSIEDAIQNNIKAFKRFSAQITQLN